MKTIYKFMIKWYFSIEKEVPRWLEKKANSNRELAVYLRGEKEFNALLSGSLRQQRNVESEDLAASILKAVEDSSKSTPESVVIDARKYFRPLVLSTAGIAALLVLTFSLRNGSERVEVESVDEVQLAQVERVDEKAPFVVKTSWKNPLDQEIEYVVSDAKGALLFLANNFLPKDYADALEDSSSS